MYLPNCRLIKEMISKAAGVTSQYNEPVTKLNGKSSLRVNVCNLFVANTSLSVCVCSVADRPTAALGALQALSREGPGLLPKRRRVLCH